jgi:hypothetical protein
VFNYRHPSPRREEGGLRAAGQVAFRRDWPDPGNPGMNSGRSIFDGRLRT